MARPVVTANKVTLCGRGTRLTEQLIQRLTLRGIKRIFVQGHPFPARSQAPIDERIRELRMRFSRVGDVPLMARIERAIEAEMVRRA